MKDHLIGSMSFLFSQIDWEEQKKWKCKATKKAYIYDRVERNDFAVSLRDFKFSEPSLMIACEHE